MSLFNQMQWQIIENPKVTYNYIKVLREKEESAEEKEKREKAERKELCKEKKAELNEEEFKKWRQKAWYQKNKERRIERQLDLYYKNKAEEEALIEDIYKDVYDTLPEPVDYNKFYAEKYDKDDRDGNWKFKFYWWCSRLNFMKMSKFKKYKLPIKIYDRGNLALIFSGLWRMQDRAYEYIKPHIDEFSIKSFKLSKKQFFTKSPMWTADEKLQQLVAGTDIANNQLYTVASALLRDKYMQTELYMGRVWFLVGDIIITQNGNILRPILENNIPWLTKDTVEELHDKRIAWLNREIDDLEVYTLWDCYFLKVHPNERETLFYFTPT